MATDINPIPEIYCKLVKGSSKKVNTGTLFDRIVVPISCIIQTIDIKLAIIPNVRLIQ